MSGIQIDHPELLGGTNPLLEAASPFIAFNKLPRALCCDPLDGCDWRSIPPELRTGLLDLSERHFRPNGIALEIADSIQMMLRGSLMARNPLSVAEQRRINVLAMARKIEDIPLQSARNRSCGGLVSAITGLGKSTITERSLSVIAPEQVVIHGKSEACGWSSLTQVLYLVIDAPSNGTRGGILARIAYGLDELLGTDYFDTYRKFRNLDAMLLYVTKLLSNHRVGLLVIDENQQDTLGESIWFRCFVLFYLGLMNLGIPVLLMGNPLAFNSLESNAQMMRRFSSGGYHRLKPAADVSERWWAKEFVPGMRRFCLCEQAPEIPEILARSFSATAGVPGLFVRLWTETQRIALRRGGEATCMSLDDLDLATKSPRVQEAVAIASAVSTGRDGRFLDIPPSADSGAVDEQVEKEAQGSVVNSATTSKAQSQLDAMRAEFERSQRKREKKEMNRIVKKELGTEDLRAFEKTLEKFAGIPGTQDSLLLGGEKGSPKMR